MNLSLSLLADTIHTGAHMLIDCGILLIAVSKRNSLQQLKYVLGTWGTALGEMARGKKS